VTLYAFLDALDARRLHYEMARHREETIMVKVAVPGERWEVEFFEDGGVDVEVFRTMTSELEGPEALTRLLKENEE
jgi:hypothetical protein